MDLRPIILMLVGLISIVRRTAAISIDLIKSDPYCFKISGQINDTIRTSFTISGRGEDKCRIQLYGPEKSVIKDESGKRHGYISHQIEKSGVYEICFSRMDTQIKQVSCDIFTFKANPAQSDKAENKDIHNIISKMDSVYKDLSSVSENIRQMQQRKYAHFNLNTSSRKSIRWLTFTKLLVIILVGAAQTWIVIKLFNKSQRLNPKLSSKTK